jgi:ESS family glutamate:Na+ symporter
VIELDLIDTLAFGGVVLLAGYALSRYVPVLARYNLPEPVIGGFLVALAIWLARSAGFDVVKFDTTLQAPLMVGFFTTIGFAASLSLLRVGGPQVVKFFLLAAAFAVVQNLIGIAVALGMGRAPIFGMVAGSVAMAGGPATALAFAPLFEQVGVAGAATVALAAAIAGTVAGGLFGGPVATWLIDRFALHERLPAPEPAADATTRAEFETLAAHDDRSDPLWLLRNLVAILVAMWLGGYVSEAISALGFTLPAYIGAMLVAAAIRNLDDATGWVGLRMGFVNTFGAVTLSLFLVLALMTLKLWEIAGLALPLLAIVAVQVIAISVFGVLVVYRTMGRDYESAVMTGGYVGFMLGTSANAMAVMRRLVERYGPAPAAFLVVPIVGAFFIDFTNALIITVFVNLLS